MIKRAERALAAGVDDELILLNSDSGRFFSLDDIGHCVWEFLDQPRSFDQVCDHVQGAYEVDRITCQNALAKLLGQMRDADLVEPLAS